MLKTICYTSQHTHPIPAFKLESLFHEIRLKNNELQVKGVLVSRYDRFFQILEGPETLLDVLYGTIKKDERHTDIIELLNTDIESYSFKDFGTGYITIKNLESLYGLQTYLTSPAVKSSNNVSIFLKTIESFFK